MLLSFLWCCRLGFAVSMTHRSSPGSGRTGPPRPSSPVAGSARAGEALDQVQKTSLARTDAEADVVHGGAQGVQAPKTSLATTDGGAPRTGSSPAAPPEARGARLLVDPAVEFPGAGSWEPAAAFPRKEPSAPSLALGLARRPPDPPQKPDPAVVAGSISGQSGEAHGAKRVPNPAFVARLSDQKIPEATNATSGPMPVRRLAPAGGGDSEAGISVAFVVKRAGTLIGLQGPQPPAPETGSPPVTERIPTAHAYSTTIVGLQSGEVVTRPADSLPETERIPLWPPSRPESPPNDRDSVKVQSTQQETAPSTLAGLPARGLSGSNSNAIVITGTRAVGRAPPPEGPDIATAAPAHLLPAAQQTWESTFARDSTAAGNVHGSSSLVVAHHGTIGPASTRPSLAMVDAPTSTRAEAFRLLCHRLRAAEDWRWIAVTSPRDGDEATICGAELALAYAQTTSERVLLLEVDAQKPRLAHVLGLTVPHCFALQLHQKYEGSKERWRAATVHCDNLHVMAIHPSMSAKERIRPHIFHDAVSDLLQARYGHVIVICPRVLDSADVALITGFVQGVVLTGPVGMKGSELRSAAQHLLPTKVLAVALLEGPSGRVSCSSDRAPSKRGRSFGGKERREPAVADSGTPSSVRPPPSSELKRRLNHRSTFIVWLAAGMVALAAVITLIVLLALNDREAGEASRAPVSAAGTPDPLRVDTPGSTPGKSKDTPLSVDAGSASMKPAPPGTLGSTREAPGADAATEPQPQTGELPDYGI